MPQTRRPSLKPVVGTLGWHCLCSHFLRPFDDSPSHLRSPQDEGLPHPGVDLLDLLDSQCPDVAVCWLRGQRSDCHKNGRDSCKTEALVSSLLQQLSSACREPIEHNQGLPEHNLVRAPVQQSTVNGLEASADNCSRRCPPPRSTRDMTNVIASVGESDCRRTGLHRRS